MLATLYSASIALTPGYRLIVDSSAPSSLIDAFSKGNGFGLLQLDSDTSPVTEDPSLAYWKDFARLYLSLFAATPYLESRGGAASEVPVEVPLEPDDLDRFRVMVPPMKGAEYVCAESLHRIWAEIGEALYSEILNSSGGVADYFSKRHSSLNLLGRVCFHLAENKTTPETPFAFLATYARTNSKDGSPQHVVLSQALEEYSSAANRGILLRILTPIQKASLESGITKALLESGDIYQTLAWTAKEAYHFLKEIPVFEKSGIAIRVPNWWKPKNPNRPQVSIKLGDKTPSYMGLDALVDFDVSVVLGDQELNSKEVEVLLKAQENLIFFKGQWIEVDKERLGDLLVNWKKAAAAASDGVNFGEAMRLLAGVSGKLQDAGSDLASSLPRVIAGDWLKTVLEQMANPETSKKLMAALKANLKADLRPYQLKGVSWLHQLHQLRLGGVLADDMGLGKTIQVISLLVLRRYQKSESKCLLVIPASLIGNWKSEVEKFAPGLTLWIAHPSQDGYQRPDRGAELIITTYGSLQKLAWIKDESWGLVVADEAQAIKNSAAKQTRAIKEIKSHHKIAMTGTPVENHLSDLWSLFDFVSPGLLGGAKEFESFARRKNKNGESSFSAIRKLVRPYILRRLKTDKNVIADLPEKTEIKSFCKLSKGQVALYQKSVESLAREIEDADGIKRRGLILSYLMRFKQICNHPSQLVKDGKFSEKDSGKFQRLRELCEVINEKQERVLIFTQFKEMADPLDRFLAEIFGCSGLVLHGETAVAKRADLVREFAREGGPPYFVLSLKAGGTGLNLTAASHVIHFDRWWNPAIENQATDRAFRIGQKKNVLVHKFICQGTLEEKIDMMIESKKAMATELLDNELDRESDGPLLTELSNDDLLKVVAIDINSASVE